MHLQCCMSLGMNRRMELAIIVTCLTVFVTVSDFVACLCIIVVCVVWALLSLFEYRASCVFEAGSSRFAFCTPRFVPVVQTSGSWGICEGSLSRVWPKADRTHGDIKKMSPRLPQ